MFILKIRYRYLIILKSAEIRITDRAKKIAPKLRHSNSAKNGPFHYDSDRSLFYFLIIEFDIFGPPNLIIEFDTFGKPQIDSFTRKLYCSWSPLSIRIVHLH